MIRQEWRGVRANLVRLILPAIVAVVGRLSLKNVQRLGAAFGSLGWRLSRRDRQRALDHLALAYPEMPVGERVALARACYRHMGTTATESLLMMRSDCDLIHEVVDVEGFEHIERLQAEGRSILFFTGHCGNWELLAATLNCRGCGMAVIARAANEPRIASVIVRLRQRFGTETINRAQPGASRRLLQQMRDGGALGMLIDQDTDVKGVWVPFFGKPAYTPVGAAEIALKRNLAVVPAFIERQESGRHLVRLLPVLALSDDPTEATAQMTELIEQQIRRRPEQWVWIHRRWRRQPAQE
jgi:KDO2-lipid IV(A) lauroyltransferase